MKTEKLYIDGIPTIIWGEKSDNAYLYVHGKMSRKEYAENFARVAAEKGWQVISFDLPEHGERADGTRLDVWSGTHDLMIMAKYVFARWKRARLFACSLGAYFSLMCLNDMPFERALFQSPIANMEWLVKQMMIWFDVSEERLAREGEIDTPVDALRWDYYSYILTHPVRKWNIPTYILYGARDNLQSRDVIDAFAEKFGCVLTVSKESEHPFMAETDAPIVEKWMRENI